MAIERFTTLVSDFPAVVEYREELAKAHTSQGYMLTSHEANHTEAHPHDLAAYAILQKLVDEFPDAPPFAGLCWVIFRTPMSARANLDFT